MPVPDQCLDGKIRVSVSCEHEYSDEPRTHWRDLFGGTTVIGVLEKALIYYKTDGDDVMDRPFGNDRIIRNA